MPLSPATSCYTVSAQSTDHILSNTRRVRRYQMILISCFYQTRLIHTRQLAIDPDYLFFTQIRHILPRGHSHPHRPNPSQMRVPTSFAVLSRILPFLTPAFARMCIPMLPDDHFGFWIVGSSVPSKTYSQQPLPATVATVDPAIFSLSSDFEISSTPVGLPFHLD